MLESWLDRLTGAAVISPDVVEDQIVLKVDDQLTLFETRRSGYIGGILNFDKLMPQAEVEYSLWLYLPSLDRSDELAAYCSRFMKLRRAVAEPERTPARSHGYTVLDEFAPVFHISETFAPYGGYILLKLTAGMSTKFGVYAYRREVS